MSGSAGPGRRRLPLVPKPTVPFAIVDVFGERSLTGNPLAVVDLTGDGVTGGDDWLTAVAREFNLSETVFVLAPEDARHRARLRIFTPARELPFAGHPTLGSAHAWTEAVGRQATTGTVVQECAAGLVRVRRQVDGWAFAAPPLRRAGPVDEAAVAEVTAALGLDPAAVVAQWVDNGRAGSPCWCPTPPRCSPWCPPASPGSPPSVSSGRSPRVPTPIWRCARSRPVAVGRWSRTR